MQFTHLHVHSDYSLLNGLTKIEGLLDFAKKEGMTALALTDENAVYGAVDFFVQAKEKGIKPIIGAEIRVAPNGMKNQSSITDKKSYQLVLLVKNEIGYKNLLKIVTQAHLDGLYLGEPRVDYDLLKKYSEGLIALSGNWNGEVNEKVMNDDLKGAKKKAELYQSIFGAENFYLELQHHPDFKSQKKINKGLLQISKETGIPLVACGDIHYIKKSDKSIHDILVCIKNNRKTNEVNRPNFNQFDLSFHSAEEMINFFSYIPEAIENTQKIVENCNFELEIGHTKLPRFPIPEGKTADILLQEKCEENLKNKFGEKITEIQENRMRYELDVIKKTGYASYFLIVADFVNWAKNNGIVVGPGRGSAAGSFVSYLMGITNIDPIEYNLLFERFLNPERVSMPDVDMDFADDRRDDVLNYVRKIYGNDHVAQIITFGTMAARAAIRDVGRALGYSYDFCDKISKMIPMFTTIDETLKNVPDFQRLHRENADARDLIDSARKIEGLIRHSSIHACGVVITDKPVYEYTALQKVSGNEEATVTQYASSTKFSAVEKIGLLKMDFLGLKNLTIIQNTLQYIKKLHNVEIDIDKIPLNDKKTFRLLQNAQTTGIFQLESNGMKRYLKLLGPTIFEDIIAMVALYRPGPMDLIPDFIERKHGRKEVIYLHPKLESILSDTYGVAVYQEQLMKIVQSLAGFSLGEADILRKAIGKKIIKLIKEQKIKFIESCVKNGVEKKIAEKVFAFIEPFAGYGFNRSHAACYALIGYQTAYLKAYYPAEFMAALMTSDEGDTDRIAIEATECREMEIKVLPPDINESFEPFAVIYEKEDLEKKNPRIRFGLNSIKNVGYNIAREIVQERKRNGKYKDISDFCERVNSRDLNKKSIEALAMVGAFDCFANRDHILANIETILTSIKELNTNRNSAQNSLFGSSALSKIQIKLDRKPQSDKKQHLAWEKQLLGLYVSDHPATNYQEFLEIKCISLNSLTKEMAEQNITIGGIIVSFSKILLKTGKNMAFITLEDGKSSVECLIFPKLLEETKDEFYEEGKAVILTGKISAKDGELKFLADSIKEITDEEILDAKRLVATRNRYSSNSNLNSNLVDLNDNSKKSDDLIENKSETFSGEKESFSSANLKQKDFSQENKAQNFEVYSKKNVKNLTIKLPEVAGKEIIENLKLIFDSCEKGETQIFLEHKNRKMKTNYLVELNDETERKLANLIGEGSLEKDV